MTQEGHNSCPHFGKGKDYHRNDAERLARMLVLKNVLAEDMVIGNHDNVICYVKLGPKAIDLLQGRYKVHRMAHHYMHPSCQSLIVTLVPF